MTVFSMSDDEIYRVTVLRDLAEKRLKVFQAAEQLQLGNRQVLRLAKAFKKHGAGALVSRRRGQPGNRSYPADLRNRTTAIIRERYADFGPQFASEKLAAMHNIHLSRETVRAWMMTEGLWKDRKQRLKPVHQPRHRRACVGELVKIDGSDHGRFADRGPRCTLLVFIDDATSRLMHLQFVETESAFDYFVATRAYIERHGKPVAFYSVKQRPKLLDAVFPGLLVNFARCFTFYSDRQTSTRRFGSTKPVRPKAPA